ncbi:hypothetical protein BV898_01555 [Hypsibius exemplaris]|uniref:Extradiol ring-cleavage dioxygenase class III enzyme subunit B domain-containing protein n=1 Tax=Hypsibius exemplaris TaxID=2072580 RepID=A0A1W0XAH1_HYPEX|nr:hypothetical protein BV898_01555 [Hypsibius exemplaris]
MESIVRIGKSYPVTLLLGLLVVIVLQVDSKVIRAYVVPHGSLALDPSHTNFSNASAKALASLIHDSLIRVSQDVAAQNPQVIFLSTPHGIADLDKFLLYLNSAAGGVTYADSCTNATECAYKLQVSLAANASMELVQSMRKSHRVSGISAFGPPASDPPRIKKKVTDDDSGVTLPLAWAEIIPLYYIPRLNTTRVIILSHPSRRYNHSETMIPELLHLGRSLYLHLEHMPERVAVIVSADLAHTHDKDGPYGFSPTAQPFDDAIGQYLSTLDPDALLQTAGGLVSEALSCGYTGLVMLHGMISEAGLKRWSSNLLVNGHPTYYGMAVAVIKKAPRLPSLV